MPYKIALLATLVTACATGTREETTDAWGNTEECVPSGTFDITGHGALLASLNVHINASGLVETDTTAELLFILDVKQRGREADVEATPCNIKLPDIPISGQDKPIRFSPGPGLIESVPKLYASATLDGQDTCARFATEDITIVLGARMDPPTGGTLPEANADGVFVSCAPQGTKCDLAIGSNCACDQEGDKKPGGTLLAENVPAVQLDQVYVDMRTKFRLSGQVWSSELIMGEVTALLEQGILGCHKAGGGDCSAPEVNAVKKINPDITPNPSEPSTFRAIRVNTSMACKELLQKQGELFPR